MWSDKVAPSSCPGLRNFQALENWQHMWTHQVKVHGKDWPRDYVVNYRPLFWLAEVLHMQYHMQNTGNNPSRIPFCTTWKNLYGTKHICHHCKVSSLTSQTQPTPARIASSITNGEGSGDCRYVSMCYVTIATSTIWLAVNIFLVTSGVWCIPRVHGNLPNITRPCVILKVIRTGVGWVWLARLVRSHGTP